jgi:predicted Zn-dependent protease
LPPWEKIREEVEKMIASLAALRKAEVLLPYTGPAILCPEITSVLFHEALGHRLEGERLKDETEGHTFKGKFGKVVIPEFLTIIDDPTMKEWGGLALAGHYLYDEEGIPAQKVILIEKGILKNYLLSRSPVKEFKLSNGHGRSCGYLRPRARMANFIIQSSKKVSKEKLKALLIEECKRQKKPYGLIIKGLHSGLTTTKRYGFQAFCETPKLVYRVDLETGEEILVRGVEIVGTPLIAINKIIATGEEEEVFNGYCGAESGTVPLSSIAPSSLSTEIELQKKGKDNRRPPLLPPPFGEKKHLSRGK